RRCYSPPSLAESEHSPYRLLAPAPVRSPGSLGSPSPGFPSAPARHRPPPVSQLRLRRYSKLLHSLVLSLSLQAPKGLRTYAYDFSPPPLHLFRAHARANALELPRIPARRRGFQIRSHPCSARDTRRQKLGILIHEGRQVLPHRSLTRLRPR